MKKELLAAAVALLFILGNAIPAQSRPADEEYQKGLDAYKVRNYRTAAKHFESALSQGNGTAPCILYLANSMVLIGNKSEAIKYYRQVATAFKGLEPEKVALKALKSLDPHNQWRDPKAPSSASQAKQPFMNRITIIDPTIAGHPRVGPDTIAIVKSVITGLPATIYKILDDGGATIHIGPNITDKWPDALNASKPGMEEITLAQEQARTYGRDIYLWERYTYTGTNKLGPPIGRERLSNELLYQCGHALDDCLGPMWETREFRKQFDLDKAVLSDDDKLKLKYYLQPEYRGCGEVIASIFAKYLGSKSNSEEVEKHFPRCKDFVVKRIERERLAMTGLAAKSTLSNGRSAVNVQTYGKTASTLSSITPKGVSNKQITTKEEPAADKSAEASKFDVIPDQESVHYTRKDGDHIFVPGTINGQPIEWLFDTGAYRVNIGKQHLVKMGIPLPKEPAKIVGYGARGAHTGWTMDLDVGVGKIKRRLKVSVNEDESIPPLLGQPFLRGMHYKLDRSSEYIQFIKGADVAAKHTTLDAIEVPFRMVDDNMIVVVKVNGHTVEMNFDTGAPAVYFNGRDLERIGLHVAADGKSLVIREIELGPIRKQNMAAYYIPSDYSVIGQTFFGERRFVVDNEKNVIRFAR